MRSPARRLLPFFLLLVLVVFGVGIVRTFFTPERTRAMLAGKAESESAQRQLVRRVLSRDDVREGAARLGLNLQQADSAVATLTGSELRTLAEQASSIESSSLTGGASTVVISTTTLLLILIIVILLAN